MIKKRLHYYLFSLAITFIAFNQTQAKGLTDLEGSMQFNNYQVTDGLSQGYVFDVLQDHHGFIWLATQNGLNRFDGKSFKIFSEKENRLDGFLGVDIRSLFLDNQHRLWVGTNGQGVNIIDLKDYSVKPINLSQQDDNQQLTNAVITIQAAPNGTVWLGTRNGIVIVEPNNNFQQTHIKLSNEPASYVSNRVRDIAFTENVGLLATGFGIHKLDIDTFELQPLLKKDHELAGVNVASIKMDHTNHLWIGSFLHGIYKLSATDHSFTQFQNIKNSSRQFRKIREIFIDDKQRVWATSEMHGLLLFDPDANTFKAFRAIQGQPFALTTNNLISIYQDRAGLFWIGSLGEGVFTTDISGQKTINLVRNPFDRNDKTPSNIWSINREKNGDYWLGSNGDGLNRVNAATGITQRMTPTDIPNGYHLSQVWSIEHKDPQHLWVGTWSDGIFVYDKTTNKVSNHFHRNKPGTGFLESGALDILKLRNGDTLFGTKVSGLFIWRESEQRFFQLSSEHAAIDIQKAKIFDIYQDDKGTIWAGSEYIGLIKISEDYSAITNWQHDPSNATSLPSNTILNINQDRNGHLLIGTTAGLAIKVSDNHFSRLTKADGLANDSINGIVKGCDDNIWLTTDQGLSKYHPVSKRLSNLGTESGIANLVFNTNAVFEGQDCELAFGGRKGLTVINPKKTRQQAPISIKLVDILKYKSSVSNNRPLDHLDRFQLSYDENLFTLAFAILNFTRQQDNQYYYRLDGPNQRWINLGSQNYIDFFDLGHGEHVVEVKGSIGPGQWTNTLKYTIDVEPPFWLSTFAYVLYFAVFCIILASIAYAQYNKIKLLKAVAASERKVSKSLREFDRLKDQFLANTSHELRTPLNAVNGLSDMVLTEGVENFSKEELEEHFGLIKTSGEHLLSLVSDILDYSAINAGKVKVEFQQTDIEPIVRALFSELKLIYKGSTLEIKYHLQPQFPEIEVDKKRLYQILLNILNNALKFTEKGFVHLNGTYDRRFIYLKILDSGTGIPKEKLQAIFERFEQVDSSDKREFGGAGLGLAITKELVELHNGSIDVESELGKGTTFTVILPRHQHINNI